MGILLTIICIDNRIRILDCTLEYKDGECQTDRIFDLTSTASMTDDAIISTVTMESKIDSQNGNHSIKTSTNKPHSPNSSADVVRESSKSVKSASLRNSSVITLKSVSDKKTHCKEINFNCHVKLRKLLASDISSMCYSLGQITKIPYKTYIERKKAVEKVNSSSLSSAASASSSVTKKFPSLTNHLIEKSKLTSNDPCVKSNNQSLSAPPSSSSLPSSQSSKTSSKRSNNDESNHQKKAKKK